MAVDKRLAGEPLPTWNKGEPRPKLKNKAQRVPNASAMGFTFRFLEALCPALDKLALYLAEDENARTELIGEAHALQREAATLLRAARKRHGDAATKRAQNPNKGGRPPTLYRVQRFGPDEAWERPAVSLDEAAALAKLKPQSLRVIIARRGSWSRMLGDHDGVMRITPAKAGTEHASEQTDT